jgi:hypothetical protein
MNPQGQRRTKLRRTFSLDIRFPTAQFHEDTQFDPCSVSHIYCIPTLIFLLRYPSYTDEGTHFYRL